MTAIRLRRYFISHSEVMNPHPDRRSKQLANKESWPIGTRIEVIYDDFVPYSYFRDGSSIPGDGFLKVFQPFADEIITHPAGIILDQECLNPKDVLAYFLEQGSIKLEDLREVAQHKQNLDKLVVKHWLDW